MAILFSVIAGKKNFQKYPRRGQTQLAYPINEEQLLEIKLIESSLLLNNRMKIIISVCFFRDGVGHWSILALFVIFCVILHSRSNWAYDMVHNLMQYLRILFVVLNCCGTANQ